MFEDLGPEAAAWGKRARLSAVTLGSAAVLDTVDEDPPTAGWEDEAMDSSEDVAANTLEANRMLEVETLEKFEAFEVVPRGSFPNAVVLKTRFVDTSEKSRFVAKEFNTFSTDDFYAQASTVLTSKLIDVIAAARCHARLVDVVG